MTLKGNQALEDGIMSIMVYAYKIPLLSVVWEYRLGAGIGGISAGAHVDGAFDVKSDSVNSTGSSGNSDVMYLPLV